MIPIQIPLMFKLGAGAVAAVLMLIGYGVWHHKVYKEGYNACRIEWNAAINKAITEGNEARTDAERDVGPATPDELRNDRYCRDCDK